VSSIQDDLAQEEATVAREEEKLKLGKGAAFVKSRFKRLRQEDETWEADFQALPKPITQSATHYLGMVVTQPDGFYLAEMPVEYTPGVNDLATLLANAIKRPLIQRAHRPRRILVRKNPRWKELFRHLQQIGVEVAIQDVLPTINRVFERCLQDMQEARSARKIKPTKGQAAVEKAFPAIAQWVRDGHIEIGDQEGFGFVAMALDYGGVVFEDDRPRTLAEAMAALEEGLAAWYEDQGMELE
jgi:hypothetical protein